MREYTIIFVFLFILTSLCVYCGSRFIHLIRTHSHHSFLWLSNMCFISVEYLRLLWVANAMQSKWKLLLPCSLWITVYCTEGSQIYLVKSRSIKQWFSLFDLPTELLRELRSIRFLVPNLEVLKQNFQKWDPGSILNKHLGPVPRGLPQPQVDDKPIQSLSCICNFKYASSYL